MPQIDSRVFGRARILTPSFSPVIPYPGVRHLDQTPLPILLCLSYAETKSS